MHLKNPRWLYIKMIKIIITEGESIKDIYFLLCAIIF